MKPEDLKILVHALDVVVCETIAPSNMHKANIQSQFIQMNKVISSYATPALMECISSDVSIPVKMLCIKYGDIRHSNLMDALKEIADAEERGLLVKLAMEVAKLHPIEAQSVMA